MQIKFWRGVFTDKDGNPSSKRIILFTLILVFVAVVFINLLMGKNLDSVLKEQLFYLVIYTLATVFGENVTGIFKKKTPGQETTPIVPPEEGIGGGTVGTPK